MLKDKSYHESAVLYNDTLAAAAEKLLSEVEHPYVKSWCHNEIKRYRSHARKHRAALERVLARESKVSPEPAPEESQDVTKSAETDVATDEFTDGCVGYHNPQSENCEFYPRGEVNG